jgi:hypothetical protein
VRRRVYWGHCQSVAWIVLHGKRDYYWMNWKDLEERACSLALNVIPDLSLKNWGEIRITFVSVNGIHVEIWIRQQLNLKYLCYNWIWSICATTEFEVSVLQLNLKYLCYNWIWSICAITEFEVSVLQLNLKYLCYNWIWSICATTEFEVSVLQQCSVAVSTVGLLKYV